jgi:hypothetical protein
MTQHGPDIVRRNERGVPIAIVEVKHVIRPRDRDYFLRQLGDYLRAVGTARYSMLVDPVDIEIFEGDPTEGRSWKLPTKDVLVRYDRAYPNRHHVNEGYLSTLVNAWLDDLSYHAPQTLEPQEAKVPQGLLDALRAA